MVSEAEITFILNGRDVTVRVPRGRSLLAVLREDLDLTGTKQSCDSQGECGACTVLLDGEAVRSCLVPIEKAAGRRVTTIEGLAALYWRESQGAVPSGVAGDSHLPLSHVDGGGAGGEKLHPLQQAFIDYGAVQCGYCTPGMILAAAALLARRPDPSPEQILEALEGNLCRCTGYATIVEAVRAAGATLRGEAPPTPPAGAVPGGSQTRLDAHDKVTGAARYAEDIKRPGLLHAAVVRSPHPHARLLAVDPLPAASVPGVVRVLTAADVPGLNDLGTYSPGEHLLAAPGGTVRMIGDPVAIILAESPEAARAGAAAAGVDYQALPHIYSLAAALDPGALPIHPGGNELSRFEIRHGDAPAALADADVVVEAHYQTAFQEHSAMEREGVLAYWDDDGTLVVVGAHQQPHWARDWIAPVVGLPAERVRVVVPPVGGTFGGKQDPWPLMAGALAAYHAPGRRPVRLAYTRRESFDASPKRHPYGMAFRVGASADGRLAGLHLRVAANTGAYDSAGRHIPEYALVAGCGPYRWPAADAAARTVYTNGPKAGQMRGFGTPQSVFGLECTLDELAGRLGIDPLELRLRNALDGETPTVLGYPAAETLGYRECLEAIRPHYAAARARAAEWNAAHGADAWRRGVGLAGMWYRFGKSGPITCEAHAELGLDGSLALFFSAPDYGQGTTTVMGQLAAEALGVPPGSLRLVNADTGLTPDSGIQGASRSTYWVGGAVQRAAALLRDRIAAAAAELLDLDPAVLALDEGAVVGPGGARVSLAEVAAEMGRIGQERRVRGVYAPEPQLSGPRPEYLPFFISGAHLAEVEVSCDTGEVRVLRMVAAHDVGRAINPLGARGQIEGAVLMGIGAALMEEYLPGASTGFNDYYLPTVRAMPEIEVILVEVPSRWGPLGAKGLGEAASLPSTPAILNAVCHATGARVRCLPATPERVLAALRPL